MTQVLSLVVAIILPRKPDNIPLGLLRTPGGHLKYQFKLTDSGRRVKKHHNNPDDQDVVRSRRFIAVLATVIISLVAIAKPVPAWADDNAVVGSAFVPGQSGYWLVTAKGDVRNHEGAADYGDLNGSPLNKPIVGMAATPSGRGYWLVATDGGIFAFGDAGFFGSTGGIALNKPVVGMSSTPSGRGYWLVASDGGIFAYGDAAFYGSTGAIKLNKPVVGMSSTPSGLGYWLVSTDGGIFAYGDAAFYGSTGSLNLNKPVVGMATSSTGRGYWLAASDGGVFAFGDAAFRGSGAGSVKGAIATFVPETSGGYVIVDSIGSVLRFPGSSSAVAENTANAPVFTTIPTIELSPTNPNTNDLPGWKYIFGDSFETNAASGQFLNKYQNWGAYDTGWQDTSRRGMYDTNQLSVQNGVMNIAMGTGADGKPRTSVPFPLINGRNSADEINQLYGRYEVRFRADAIQGYKTAFLLWPKSEVWPRDGEIDFPEGAVNGNIEGYVHRQGASHGGDQAWFHTNTGYTTWHTATIEWSPNLVRLMLDGNVIGQTNTRVPNTPMHWVLQTETCLDGCAIPANASGNVQIDYVKVWKYQP